MPGQNSGHDPADNAKGQPVSQFPVAPEQDEMEKLFNRSASDKESETVKLERDIKKGEIWLIGMNGTLLITTIVIACIYNGQLNQMRIATEAAKKSADTADATLKEIRQGGTDTHDLAVAAKKQAEAAKTQSQQAEAQVKEIKRLSDETRDMAKETKRSADIATSAIALARENFTRDQRPWLVFKIEQPKFEDGKQVIWNVHIVNSGRTPAIHTTHCTVIWWGPAPINDINDERINKECAKAISVTSETTISPGTEIFTSAITANSFTGDALKQVKDQDVTLLLTARITYRDTFGNEYRTTFCGMHLATGAAKICGKYNEMK